jgi:hypothetical protein
MILDSIIVAATVVSAAAYLVWRLWPRRRAASPCSGCVSKARHAVPVRAGGTR